MQVIADQTDLNSVAGGLVGSSDPTKWEVVANVGGGNVGGASSAEMCPGGSDAGNMCLGPLEIGRILGTSTVTNIVNNGFSQPGSYMEFTLVSLGGSAVATMVIDQNGHPTASVSSNGTTTGMCISPSY